MPCLHVDFVLQLRILGVEPPVRELARIRVDADHMDRANATAEALQEVSHIAPDIIADLMGVPHPAVRAVFLADLSTAKVE